MSRDVGEVVARVFWRRDVIRHYSRDLERDTGGLMERNKKVWVTGTHILVKF